MRRWLLTGAGFLLAAVTGVGLVAGNSDAPERAEERVAAEQAAPEPQGSVVALAPPVENSVASSGGAAVDVKIDAIGVSSELELLGLNADGTLEVPEEWGSAGWFKDGVVPGEMGPAVIVGHVDSRSGPAVFYRLDELETGDLVEVGRSDGTTARFAVTRTMRASKADFPTSEVYGPTTEPELRLITCDGDFDRGTGHYTENLVVFAVSVP